MDDRIVIFGTGTFAQVVASYLPTGEGTPHTVDGAYVADSPTKLTVPFDLIQDMYPPNRYKVFIAVTQQNKHRFLLREIYERVREKGYELASIVHPTAFVGNGFKMGKGCLISPHAIIEPRSGIGTCVFIRSGAYVGHDTAIASLSYVAPRASIAGHCTIGQNVFIGNNATIRDRLTIGDNAVIGCGVTVLHHVEPNTVIKAREGTLLPIDAREVNI